MMLELLPDTFSVCRLDPTALVPTWALQGSFYSMSKTRDELSIVCLQADVPSDVRAERNWRCLMVKGPLDFGLTGILASLAAPLAKAGISIFALSTFDTDYLLVKEERVRQTIEVLSEAGHEVQE